MALEQLHDRRIPRRRLLQLGAAGALTALAPGVLAQVKAAPERALRLHNLQTGEELKAVYWAQGRYVPSELEAINHLLRDFHTDQIIEIDTKLLDLLYVLRDALETRAPYYVISGYRSPETNAMLAEHMERVAKHSYHILGMAVDVRLASRETKELRRAALALRRGGVGYYESSDFLHLDTGPFRAW